MHVEFLETNTLLLQYVVETKINAMDDPECGVFVHWGIEGSGESIAAARLAQKLRSEKGHSVLFLDHHSSSCFCCSDILQDASI